MVLVPVLDVDPFYRPVGPSVGENLMLGLLCSVGHYPNPSATILNRRQLSQSVGRYPQRWKAFPLPALEPIAARRLSMSKRICTIWLPRG